MLGCFLFPLKNFVQSRDAMKHMDVGGKTVIEVMLYFTGKPSEFRNKSSQAPRVHAFRKGSGLHSQFPVKWSERLHWPKCELIRAESIRASLFLTRERRSGESLAERRCECRNKRINRSGSSSKICRFGLLSSSPFRSKPSTFCRGGDW